jgi:hypothetical protein
VALGVPGRLRPRIFSIFGTTRVVGRQTNTPAAFTPGEIPGTHFQRLSRPQGTWFCRKEPRKKFQVTPPGIDPGTVRLVATPGPVTLLLHTILRSNESPQDYLSSIKSIQKNRVTTSLREVGCNHIHPYRHIYNYIRKGTSTTE